MVSGKPAWEDCSVDTLFRIGFSDKLTKREPIERWSCDQLLQHPFISSSSPNYITEASPRSVLCFSRADLKSAEERRSCRVEKSRVELEELEGIGAESANAVWFQREKRLNCCCLNKYKARNSDSLIRSVGESTLTMEILVVNKFRTSVVK
ncbi:hypothetical protein PVL29_021013 [Vitis rotundifolia]|uniref:Protein kinase domain-containing protein n=1 Tax=Vitis rotundifolia TaxID=103349 RepID=A0AA39DBK1_VITRO|nr:hypothetical protein PVL29_021013 [Vitis rotundifolia]